MESEPHRSYLPGTNRPGTVTDLVEALQSLSRAALELAEVMKGPVQPFADQAATATAALARELSEGASALRAMARDDNS